eukprot:423884-Amphidinium_carterae.1
MCIRDRITKPVAISAHPSGFCYFAAKHSCVRSYGWSTKQLLGKSVTLSMAHSASCGQIQHCQVGATHCEFRTEAACSKTPVETSKWSASFS